MWIEFLKLNILTRSAKADTATGDKTLILQRKWHKCSYYWGRSEGVKSGDTILASVD